MNIGTKSILFGVHQFVLHPLMVLWAWRIIYREWPRLHEWCAIVTHDLGYWGSPDMDGERGERHPEYVANWWFDRKSDFGDKVAVEILCHSRFYAGKNGWTLSRLFQADKLSMVLYPRWLYLLLGNLSGEIHEYISHASTRKGKYLDIIKVGKGQLQWLIETQAHMALMGLHGRDYAPVADQMEKDKQS